MSNQPHVALILYGNLRSYNITYRTLETYLLQPYKCDIYLTTYNNRFNIKHGTQKEEEVTEASVRKVYGNYLKSITIVEQDKFVEHYMRKEGKNYRFGGDLDRFFTIEKLAKLAYDTFRGACERNKITYDFVIRMRPDIQLNERFILNTSLNEDQIVVPVNNSGGCFNDHFAYGKLKSMSKYFNYYSHYHEIDWLDDGHSCDVSVIEDGLKKYLDVSGVCIQRIPIKYMILRDTKPQKVIFFSNSKNKNDFYVKKF